MRGRGRRFVAIAAIVAAIGGVVACGSDGGDATGDGRTAAVYAPILVWLGGEAVANVGEQPDWTMFVASRSHDEIDIDAQVELIATLDGEIDLRFIDERDEAVDPDAERGDVRDGGMLVGLGAVEEEGNRVEVYADRYRRIDDVQAWLVTVARSGDTWQIVGAPEVVEARPLPPDG